MLVGVLYMGVGVCLAACWCVNMFSVKVCGSGFMGRHMYLYSERGVGLCRCGVLLYLGSVTC